MVQKELFFHGKFKCKCGRIQRAVLYVYENTTDVGDVISLVESVTSGKLLTRYFTCEEEMQNLLLWFLVERALSRFSFSAVSENTCTANSYIKQCVVWSGTRQRKFDR